jgi:hypothetical protein
LKTSEKNFMYYYNFQKFQNFGESHIGIDVLKKKKKNIKHWKKKFLVYLKEALQR